MKVNLNEAKVQNSENGVLIHRLSRPTNLLLDNCNLSRLQCEYSAKYSLLWRAPMIRVVLQDLLTEKSRPIVLVHSDLDNWVDIW